MEPLPLWEICGHHSLPLRGIQLAELNDEPFQPPLYLSWLPWLPPGSTPRRIPMPPLEPTKKG